ncbi:MAG: type II secretion system protein [Candidatus Gastranaerophilaceae bacterium]
MEKKNFAAFTLPEILITLMIISVIATMTIPTVMNYFQEKSLLTQFQKIYSTLSQAYILAAMENGTADGWGTDQNVYNYLKPYLKIIEDCPKTVGCFPDFLYSFKGVRGTGFGSWNIGYKVRLQDGASILFQSPGDAAGVLYVDINGNKAPNKWGSDTFVLQLINKAGAPVVVGYAADWADVRFCSSTGDASGWIDGGSCSNWVIKHGNMDYLHRDIPSVEWNN